MNYGKALERNCDIYPSVTAMRIIYPQKNATVAIEEISWLEFNKRCNKIANLLLSRKIKKGDTIAIAVADWVAKTAIVLASLKIGAEIKLLPQNENREKDESAFAAVFWQVGKQKILLRTQYFSTAEDLASLAAYMDDKNPVQANISQESEHAAQIKNESMKMAIISQNNTEEKNIGLCLEAVRQNMVMVIWNSNRG